MVLLNSAAPSATSTVFGPDAFTVLGQGTGPDAFADAAPDAFANAAKPPTPKNSVHRHRPEAEEDADWPSQHLTIWREIPFVFLLCMAQGATQWGLAMSIAPLHIVGAHFGIDGDAAQESWSAAAYSLTVGTFILVAGRLGDLYGHKRLFIIGWLWYALWSVIGGVSYWGPNVILFDFCRGMQGIGPALLFPNALAILGRTYPPGRRKEMVFSCFGLAAPSGFLIGSVFAGLIAQLSFWPWLYWANALACVLCALLAIPLVPAAHAYNPIRDEPGHLDVPGCATGVAGLVLVNFAWNQGPGAGWGTWYVYVLLIVGFCFLGLFVWIELHARHPLIPLKSLSTEIVLVLGAVAAGWASFGIWLYYLYQMWEVLRGQTPLASAAQISPVAVAGACAAITTGLVISKIHPGWLMLFAMTAFTAGNILLATMPVEQTYWAQSFVATIVTPWGMDMSFPASNIMVSNFMPRSQQGLSASLVNTVINYSISIGLGVAGTVEARVLANGGSTLDGYRAAWYVGIGLGALGMAISACLLLLTGGKRGEGKRASLRAMELMEGPGGAEKAGGEEKGKGRGRGRLSVTIREAEAGVAEDKGDKGVARDVSADVPVVVLDIETTTREGQSGTPRSLGGVELGRE